MDNFQYNNSFPLLSELIIFLILLTFISFILSIVWIVFVTKLESYCTLMQKSMAVLFSIRVVLLILLTSLLILIKLGNDFFYLSVITNILNIITKSLFLVVLFLAASGWMSIRFSKVVNEIKMNYSVYLYILIYLNSSVCSMFFFKGKLIQPYDYFLMIYVIFIIYTSNRSYHTLKEKYSFLIEIQEEFNKCFKIKKYRFTMISWLCLSYLILYTLTIWIDNVYAAEDQTKFLTNFGSVIRILVDSIIITLFLVLFKPSSIILKDHINPNRNISNPVRFYYLKAFYFKYHKECYIYSHICCMLTKVNDNLNGPIIIINPIDYSSITSESQRKKEVLYFKLGKVIHLDSNILSKCSGKINSCTNSLDSKECINYYS